MGTRIRKWFSSQCPTSHLRKPATFFHQPMLELMEVASLALSSNRVGQGMLSGTVNFSGMTIWAGGTMAGAGVTNLYGGLTISNGANGTFASLNGRVIHNAGPATIAATQTNWSNGGAFNNLATGSVDIQSNITFANAGDGRDLLFAGTGADHWFLANSINDISGDVKDIINDLARGKADGDIDLNQR